MRRPPGRPAAAAAVEQAEAVGGAAGEHQLARVVGRRAGAGQVLGRGRAGLAVEALAVVLQVAVGVGLEAAAVPLDGLGHRARMRGEHERGEVALGRVELERARPRPSRRRGRRRRRVGPVRLAAGQPGQDTRAGQEPGAPQQGPAVQLLHALLGLATTL